MANVIPLHKLLSLSERLASGQSSPFVIAS